jgi:hypothetical protein
LPNYGQVLDLAADGSAAAMVNFNQNDPEKRFTESLFLVTNQGRGGTAAGNRIDSRCPL